MKQREFITKTAGAITGISLLTNPAGAAISKNAKRKVALEMGADVLTEWPMATDEIKCQAIHDAEKSTGKKCIVGFNYRYGTLFTAIRKQLAKNPKGKITSVDFNPYVNVFHGADYFRRSHEERDKGGTLGVQKATHHFDLLNWKIDSDPVEVTAIIPDISKKI